MLKRIFHWIFAPEKLSSSQLDSEEKSVAALDGQSSMSLPDDFFSNGSSRIDSRMDLAYDNDCFFYYNQFWN